MVTRTPAANKTVRIKALLPGIACSAIHRAAPDELCTAPNFNHRVTVRSDPILAAGVVDSMQDESAPKRGAVEVVNWMLSRGRHNTHMREFGDEMCRRIVAAGIPLGRAFCSVATLHPQVVASTYTWRREDPGAVRRAAPHAFTERPEWTRSPVAELKRTGRPIRRKSVIRDARSTTRLSKNSASPAAPTT
jgi:hypothetical protein